MGRAIDPILTPGAKWASASWASFARDCPTPVPSVPVPRGVRRPTPARAPGKANPPNGPGSSVPEAWAPPFQFLPGVLLSAAANGRGPIGRPLQQVKPGAQGRGRLRQFRLELLQLGDFCRSARAGSPTVSRQTGENLRSEDWLRREFREARRPGSADGPRGCRCPHWKHRAAAGA